MKNVLFRMTLLVLGSLAFAAQGFPCCDEVPHVQDVVLPINQDNGLAGGPSINVLSTASEDKKLFAIYMGGETGDRIFVAEHCQEPDVWRTTNHGQPLNLHPPAGPTHGSKIFYSRLVEYRDEIYAIFQETVGYGEVLQVMRYVGGTEDRWEIASDGDELGLSQPYVGDTEAAHFAQFNPDSVIVYDDSLYVVWTQWSSTTSTRTIVKKYDGNCLNTWEEMDPVDPGVVLSNVAMGEHDGDLYLAATRAGDGLAKIKDLYVYHYDKPSGQWTEASGQLSRNRIADKHALSLVSSNDKLYLAWWEATYVYPTAGAYPHNVWVREYQGGTTWSYTPGNPVIRNDALIPILLDYKCTPTLVAAEGETAYFKQFNGTAWVDFDQPLDGIETPLRFEEYSAVSSGDTVHFAWRSGNSPNFFCGFVSDE